MNINIIKAIVGVASVGGLIWLYVTTDKSGIGEALEKVSDVFCDIPSIDNSKTMRVINDISKYSNVGKAITSIADDALGMDFDHNKIESAKTIVKIAKRAGVSSLDKGTAIDALTKIAGTCDFSYNKRSVMSLVQELL